MKWIFIPILLVLILFYGCGSTTKNIDPLSAGSTSIMVISASESKLLPGDTVAVNIRDKRYIGKVVEHTPQGTIMVVGEIYGWFIPSQLTFISHDPAISKLLEAESEPQGELLIDFIKQLESLQRQLINQYIEKTRPQ